MTKNSTFEAAVPHTTDDTCCAVASHGTASKKYEKSNLERTCLRGSVHDHVQGRIYDSVLDCSFLCARQHRPLELFCDILTELVQIYTRTVQPCR